MKFLRKHHIRCKNCKKRWAYVSTKKVVVNLCACPNCSESFSYNLETSG